MMVLYRAYIYCACPLIVLNIPLDSATATHMSSDSHGPVAPVTTLIQGRAEGDGVEAGVCHVPLSYLTIGDRRRRPVRRRTVVQDLAPGERHRVYVSTGPQLLLAAWRQIHSARFSSGDQLYRARAISSDSGGACHSVLGECRSERDCQGDCRSARGNVSVSWEECRLAGRARSPSPMGYYWQSVSVRQWHNQHELVCCNLLSGEHKRISLLGLL